MADAPDRLAGSLVRIRAAGERGEVAGGGLLVDERRVITCAHVVEAATRDRTPAAGARVCVEFPPFEDGTSIAAAAGLVMLDLAEWA